MPTKIMSLHSNYQPSRAWVSLCLEGLSTAEKTSEAWYLLKPKLHTGTGVVAAQRGRGVVVAITQSFVLNEAPQVPWGGTQAVWQLLFQPKVLLQQMKKHTV